MRFDDITLWLPRLTTDEATESKRLSRVLVAPFVNPRRQWSRCVSTVRACVRARVCATVQRTRIEVLSRLATLCLARGRRFPSAADALFRGTGMLSRMSTSHWLCTPHKRGGSGYCHALC